MWLDDYFQKDGQKISFSREQASRFAKRVADDFNPIHDVDAKRFCVPGDLLFALTLNRFGISARMDFTFADMVTDGVALHFTEQGDRLALVDDAGKTYMSLEASGEHKEQAALAEQLTRAYVAFSGHTFPHILVPLWREQGVMINPTRPMVIYQSMHLAFDTLDVQSLSLVPEAASMSVDGKRGQVVLGFTFADGERQVGRGEKRMVLSGLRPFEEEAVAGVVAFYNERKASL